MNLSKQTRDIQSKMALFCRSGQFNSLPGLTPNRFHHYRRLIFTILQENLEAAFPIACKYAGQDVWQAMVHDFFSRHKCQSYQVWQIAGEFYAFAVSEKYRETYQIDYLDDLLKFEWQEMVVYNMEDRLPGEWRSMGDLLNDPIILNPEHALLQLSYPIHLLQPADAARKKGNYFVLLYRESATGNVQFMDLSVWFAIVIEQIGIRQIPVKELMPEALKLFGATDLEQLTDSTIGFLEELKSTGFLLGFKNNT